MRPEIQIAFIPTRSQNLKVKSNRVGTNNTLSLNMSSAPHFQSTITPESDKAPKAVKHVGDGFNTFKASAMPNQVRSSTITHPVLQLQSAQVYVCTSLEEVLTSLDLSADVTIDSSWGSFKNRLDFASKLSTTSTSVTIIVSAFQETQTQNLDRAEFIDNNYKDALDLYQRGGDSYVDQLTMGGGFYAAYNFTADSYESSQDIANTASASFGGLVTKVDATFSTTMKNIAQKKNVKWSFSMKTFGYDGQLPDQDHVVSFAIDFPGIHLSNPDVMSFHTTSYSTLGGCPTFDAIDNKVDAYTESTLTEPSVSEVIRTGISTLKSIVAVSQLYDFYKVLDVDPRLTDSKKKLADEINRLQRWVNDVAKDPTKPGLPDHPTIDTSLLQFPITQYTPVEGSTIGTRRWDAWRDVDAQAILAGVRPTKIELKGGWRDDPAWLCMITTTYEHLDGPQSQRISHGGTGGDQDISVSLGPQDRFTKFVARGGPPEWVITGGRFIDVDYYSSDSYASQSSREQQVAKNCMDEPAQAFADAGLKKGEVFAEFRVQSYVSPKLKIVQGKAIAHASAALGLKRFIHSSIDFGGLQGYRRSCNTLTRSRS
ncbi:hypothetical protein EHS25_001946 [Saitozyma podzolica]|uniref:MACPF domain-containing protein n=1 Tax=Saitozyma podzolica TaxID=1890683 RepID=A0A427YFX6_9TREE|nr:hypothetical protein EHS25_001946 [Saitozyma podzolica]